MFRGSDGHCAECGEPLEDGWHGDHIIPYSITGHTRLSEGQPLCPRCNLKKGISMTWHDQFIPRHFQQQLMQVMRARVVAGEMVTVALASPGSGKTLAYQAAITDLFRHIDGVDFLAVYAPRLVLAKQAEIDWRHTDASGADRGFFSLFDGRCRLERLRHRVNVSPLLPPGLRREGLATTYQSLISDPDLHLGWAREHEGRFVLVGDEAQFLGAPFDEEDENSPRAGQVFEQLAQYARHVLLLTGTEERADGRKLVLCDEFYRQDERGRWFLQPHVEARYRHRIALDYLRQFDAAITDVKVVWWPGEDERVEYDLSKSGELPPGGKASLARVLRREDVWQPLCDLTVGRLRTAQEINPSYRALIACMEQQDARRVREYLEGKYRGLRVLIAVSDDGPKAEAALRDFRFGQYDVLVTVRKAFIGYDCKQITVVCPLTNYRNIGHLTQLAFRGGRIWDEAESGHAGKHQRLHLIVPDDPDMAKFIEFLRREQAEGLRERGLDREGPGPGPLREGRIEDARVTAIRGATYDRDITAEEYATGQAVLDEFGPITTPEQVQQLLLNFGITPEAQPARAAARASAPKTEQEIVRETKSTAAKLIGQWLRERGHETEDADYQAVRKRLTWQLNGRFRGGIKSTNDITTADDAAAYLTHVRSQLRLNAETA